MARPRRKGARLLLYLISQSPARKKNALFRPRLFLLGFGHGSGNRRRILRAGWPDTWKGMPKEASRYGFVLRNQTNLNRPRIGESEANPESRVDGHLERMPKEASRYGFVLRNQTILNRPRIGESEANPESRVDGRTPGKNA